MGKIIFFLCFILNPAIAAEVKLTVDKNQLTLEDQITVSISVGGQSRLTSMPQIENAVSFDIQNAGTSSQMQIINGEVSIKKVFNFVLSPKQLGSFIIGPAKVEVDGQVIASNTVKVDITKGTVEQKQNRDYFVEARVDKENPYVGEQITYVFKFLHRNATITGAKLDSPTFDGFWKEELEKQKEYEQVINGVPYSVTEIKMALFPNNAGEHTIGENILNMMVLSRDRYRESMFDSFFGGGEQKKLTLRTKPIKVFVKDLPLPRPSNFSNVIGELSILSKLTKNDFKVGDSSTLAITISGSGNVFDLKLPPLNLGDIKIYDDKPQTKTEIVGDRIVGEKIFTMALVPITAGLYKIPPIEISYFNVRTGSYEIVKTDGMQLNVTPGNEEGKYTTGGIIDSKKSVQLLAEDLRPIKRDIKNENQTYNSFFYLITYLGLGMFYFFIRYFKYKKETYANDTSLNRKKKAWTRFQMDYKRVSDSKNFMIDCSNILRVLVGDELNVDGLALTPADIERVLVPFNVSKKLIDEIKMTLQSCEMSVYGGKILTSAEQKQFGKKMYDLGKRFHEGAKS